MRARAQEGVRSIDRLDRTYATPLYSIRRLSPVVDGTERGANDRSRRRALAWRPVLWLSGEKVRAPFPIPKFRELHEDAASQFLHYLSIRDKPNFIHPCMI